MKLKVCNPISVYYCAGLLLSNSPHIIWASGWATKNSVFSRTGGMYVNENTNLIKTIAHDIAIHLSLSSLFSSYLRQMIMNPDTNVLKVYVGEFYEESCIFIEKLNEYTIEEARELLQFC